MIQRIKGSAKFLAIASLTLIVLNIALSSVGSSTQAGLLKISPTLPDGLGVNIHFTDPKPGEMEMLAGVGFRWIRMDLIWQKTEIKKGKYDFSAYDRLLTNLEKHKIRAILILDYNHQFYDKGLSPYTEVGRRAFAEWAVAAVSHFKGRDVLWEMYNEPNIGFWTPQTNVKDYIKLALAVGKAIHKTNPQEIFIGPATAGVAFPFLEECFKAGLLNYWTAVSVHPYRGTRPETATEEFQTLRKLIDRYTPKNKKIEIISGEWGYPSIPKWGYPAIPNLGKNLDEENQGKYLARQWLNNLANNIILSIWYDWQDDGIDPNNPEHKFGIVRNAYRRGQKLVFEPKPSYHSAKTLVNMLNGFQFEKRLALASTNDYILKFRNKKTGEIRLAAWTISENEHEVIIPEYSGLVRITTHLGQESPLLVAKIDGLLVTLTDAPKYLSR
jgi:polysaccharide biosynthesis protein PslG